MFIVKKNSVSIFVFSSIFINFAIITPHFK